MTEHEDARDMVQFKMAKGCILYVSPPEVRGTMSKGTGITAILMKNGKVYYVNEDDGTVKEKLGM